jgi:hypothetical protein
MGECDAALKQLATLRQQYAGDPYSQVQIDRWIARALVRTGRNEEAHALLEQLRPQLHTFQFDLAQHHHEVIQLMQVLGKTGELQSYCEKIGGHFCTNDALGHLDWMLLYASLAERVRPTEFMYTALAVCAIQLGLVVPPRGIADTDLRLLLERCVELRNHHA